MPWLQQQENLLCMFIFSVAIMLLCHRCVLFSGRCLPRATSNVFSLFPKILYTLLNILKFSTCFCSRV